jgi:hypothetical protein
VEGLVPVSWGTNSGIVVCIGQYQSCIVRPAVGDHLARNQ